MDDAPIPMTTEDGIVLVSMAHPVAPWWQRLWHAIFHRDLNEAAIEDAIVEIKGMTHDGHR